MSDDPTRYGISRGQVSPDEQAAADRAYQRQRKEDQRLLAWARKQQMSAAEATRFLARARATRQQAQRREQVLEGHPILMCCGQAHPITQIPYRTLCCGTVWFWTKEGA